jgi:hypothetical protein
MLDVAAQYLISAIAVGCALLVAILVASLARSRPGVRGRLALALLGTLLVGIAGFEKMGWSARPWALGSPAQYFDDVMFRVVWLTGISFIFIGGLARLLERRESPPRTQIPINKKPMALVR